MTPPPPFFFSTLSPSVLFLVCVCVCVFQFATQCLFVFCLDTAFAVGWALNTTEVLAVLCCSSLLSAKQFRFVVKSLSLADTHSLFLSLISWTRRARLRGRKNGLDISVFLLPWQDFARESCQAERGRKMNDLN